MQGTIVMLMALTGLGCHHKGGGHHAVAPSCYADAGCYGGCYDGTYATGQSVGYTSYAPACYATAYSACYGQTYSSCYGATWDACYSSAACYGDWGGCYGGGHSHKGLFACLKRKKCGACNGGYTGCYGNWYDAGYSTPVFGAYMPTYGGDVIYNGATTSGQMGSGQAVWSDAGGSVYSITPTQAAPATGDSVPPPATGDSPPPAETAPAVPPVDTPKVPDAPVPGAGDVPGAGSVPSVPTGDVPAVPAPGTTPDVTPR